MADKILEELEKTRRKTVTKMKRKIRRVLSLHFDSEALEQLLEGKKVRVSLPPGEGGETLEEASYKLKRSTIEFGLQWCYVGRRGRRKVFDVRISRV